MPTPTKKKKILQGVRYGHQIEHHWVNDWHKIILLTISLFALLFIEKHYAEIKETLKLTKIVDKKIEHFNAANTMAARWNADKKSSVFAPLFKLVKIHKIHGITLSSYLLIHDGLAKRAFFF